MVHFIVYADNVYTDNVDAYHDDTAKGMPIRF
jgi:hypothetical protein